MGQYFSNEQLESNIQKFSTKISGKTYSFLTDNGVFSKDKLDFGTRLLLETIPISKMSGDVLDVGCGYGPIGIYIRKNCNVNVTMCDVNKRALHLAEMNCKENHVSDIRILESDGYSAFSNGEQFDTIITNPPIRAGKKVVYEIVLGSRNYLKQSGRLFLVIRKEQGAKSLIRDLEEFYHVEVLERSKGFFILECNLLLTS